MVTLLSKLDLSGARRKAMIYSYLLNKKLSRRFRRITKPHVVEVFKYNDEYDSHLIDDLPLTINRDPQPGIQ